MSWLDKVGKALKPVARDAGKAAATSAKLSVLVSVKPALEQAIVDKMQLGEGDLRVVDDVINLLQHLKAVQRIK